MGIHGDKSQQERDWVLNGKISLLTLEGFGSGFFLFLFVLCSSIILLMIAPLHSEFRYGKAPILIATDVASRGLGQYATE